MATPSFRLAFAVAAIVVVLDQITKNWAERSLAAVPCSSSPDACIELFWTLRLHLHYNTGAAFSTGTGLGPLLAVIAAAMSVLLFNMARTRADRLGAFLLGLIAGGAIGNLSDRVIRADDGPLSGAVIDFVDFQWWPIFNVADSAVVVGVITFIVYSLIAPEAGEATAPTPRPSATEVAPAVD